MAKLLSSLPVGSLVKFGKHSVGSEAAQPIIWVVADKNHSGYPTGSVTLLAERVIDLRAYDAREPSASSTEDGNNAYELSNIHQWLNSDASAGTWYTATHSKDTPPSATNISGETEYYSRAGFLYNFESAERSVILPTTITLARSNGSAYSTISTKVFLPSTVELGLSTTVQDNSSIFPYISQVGSKCFPTSQCVTNTLSKTKPTSVTSPWFYWTRNIDVYQVLVENTIGKTNSTDPDGGMQGVRPIINVSGNLEVSDITDTDGCYRFSITNAPSAPNSVQIITSPIYTGKPCSIKWNGSTDPNGDTVNYKIHLYYDGVKWGEPISVGTATTYTLPSVKSGATSVTFGVEALDALGHSSGIISATSAVFTNYAPSISGANGTLGEKNVGFSHTYTVADADKNTVTVTEYIDNVQIRRYVATLGATNTFAVTGATWLKLTNGLHTLKITATDGIDEDVRTITFTKKVATSVVQRTTPIASDIEPMRLVVTVVKVMPPEAVFKVEACKNAFDGDKAVWYDITREVLKGEVYVFPTMTKTAGQWGVNIRVSINRNGGEGACYITEIGGNFE